VHNPEEAATRGLWTNIDFLKDVSRLPAKETIFADYHGHGWVFRGVFSQDKRGNLLDGAGKVVDPLDPDKLRKAVHLMDIHAEKGMHCVDCHFESDAHGNGKIYGEYPDAVAIQCQDCHGTIARRAQLKTTGPAGAAARDESPHRHHPVGGAPFRVGRGRAHPALDAETRRELDGLAGHRQHRPGQRALQREGAFGEDDPEGRDDLGRAARRSGHSRAPATHRWRVTPVTPPG
jgi:hypothetical protein